MRKPDREGTDNASEWSSPETAAALLRHLEQHAVGGVVSTSLPALGAALNIGRTTAFRAVRRLLDTNQLAVLRLGTSRDYPTRYRLQPTVGSAAA